MYVCVAKSRWQQKLAAFGLSIMFVLSIAACSQEFQATPFASVDPGEIPILPVTPPVEGVMTVAPLVAMPAVPVNSTSKSKLAEKDSVVTDMTITLAKTNYSPGEEITGTVTIEVSASLVANYTFDVFKDGKHYTTRSSNNVPLDPGIHTYDFKDVFGYVALFPTHYSYVGSYHFVVTQKQAGSSVADAIAVADITQKGVPPSIVADCMNDSQYNACVFYKNPVAVKGAPFSPAIRASTNLTAYQTYGVNLSGMTEPNVLRNDSFNITASDGVSRAKPSAWSWKYTYANDSNHRLSQVMAFFWLQYAVDFFKERVGGFYASDKDIKVFAYDSELSNNAYWDTSTNEIHMGYFDLVGRTDAALSAEIYVHELGHANQSYANPNIDSITSTHHLLCGGGGSVCCKTADGCALAIGEGQADYHAAVIFPQSLTIGEAVTNTMVGISECGIPRHIGLNTQLLASAAYSACQGYGLAGEPHLMGRIFAAGFWEARQVAADPEEFDQLFNEVIKVIGPDDNFGTALTKAITLDVALFGSRHSANLADKFSNHGIAPQ